MLTCKYAVYSHARMSPVSTPLPFPTIRSSFSTPPSAVSISFSAVLMSSEEEDDDDGEYEEEEGEEEDLEDDAILIVRRCGLITPRVMNATTPLVPQKHAHITAKRTRMMH